MKIIAYSLLFLICISCQSHKEISTKDERVILDEKTIEESFEVEKIYKINTNTTLKLPLQKGKSYKFQIVSKGNKFIKITLKNSKSEIVATDRWANGVYSFPSKNSYFDCDFSDIYSIEINKKRAFSTCYLVVASQNLVPQTAKKEYKFIKKFSGTSKMSLSKSGHTEYTLVLSKGNIYKFEVEKGNVTLKLSSNFKDPVLVVDSTLKNEFLFYCKSTGVYYLGIITHAEDVTDYSYTNFFIQQKEE